MTDSYKKVVEVKADSHSSASQDNDKGLNEKQFIEKYRVSWFSSLPTILGSVWSTQSKKNMSYKVGVVTILLVSAFVTVILSVAYLQSIIFFQGAQMAGSDIDIMLTRSVTMDDSVDLNINPYSMDPFQTEQTITDRLA